MSEDSTATPLQQPSLQDADLSRFKIMLQAEPSAVATHLTKEIREPGSRTNDLEDKMDAAATVLENHEQDISDIKKKMDGA